MPAIAIHNDIDIRKDSVFFCERDGRQMDFVRGRYSYYYRCPQCGFRISAREASHVRSALSVVADEEGAVTGTSGRTGNIRFRIADVRPPFFVVSIARDAESGN